MTLEELAEKWAEIAVEHKDRERRIDSGEMITCAFSPYEVVVPPDEAAMIAIALGQVVNVDTPTD